jgi:hypothetical protein
MPQFSTFKVWEWNKDSLAIMEMQVAELQALCTHYNLKPAKIGKATVATAIVNHLMVPRADVVTKQDVHNAIEVTMEQVAENILAPAMEAKIVTVAGQVKTLQNKVDAMAKSFDTMQDSGESGKRSWEGRLTRLPTRWIGQQMLTMSRLGRQTSGSPS